MQLKYRITFAYTLIVTVILLLLCSAIYVVSIENMEDQFRQRLKGRGLSAARLLKMKEFDMADIRLINQTSPSVFAQRSISVINEDDKIIYEDNLDSAARIAVTYDMLKYTRASKTYYFKVGQRDAVGVLHGEGKHKYVILVAALDEETMEWKEKLKLILAICLVSSVLLVVFSGYVFSIRLVRSITKLKTKVDRISSEHFSQRLDTGSGRDELQKLAMTINDLLDRLQLSFDTQRRFIDNASHELSTPLTAIYSQLEIALQRERSPEEYRKALISLKTDVKRLNLLLRSLLEIAKASGSETGIELSTVRIDELLMKLPSDLRRIGPFYDVKLEYEYIPDNEFAFDIYGNEPLLFIAFKNIAHNACKYSKDKTAFINLSITENYIIVRISDNGPGIASDDLKNIFQPFYRAGNYNNFVQGSGLGLALTHHIIGLHNGEIEVESEVGVGSVFTVILPR